MKYLFVILMVLSFRGVCFADGPQIQTVQSAMTAPSPIPAPTALQAEVAPVSVSQPPAWLGKALDTASTLPIVGPVVVTVLKWLGVIATIMTLLVTCLIGIVRTLIPVVNLARLTSIATALQAFQDGTVMYWLKFFSVYNAKKPEDKDGADKAAA